MRRSTALNLVLGVLAVAPFSLHTTRAHACGASGGAVGAAGCSLSEHEEEVRNKWRVGATYGFTSTRIRFDGDPTFRETRHTVLATLAYAPTPRWTFEVGAGALVSGELERGATFEMRPGLVATLGTSFRVLDGAGARPFVVLTGQLAYANSSTKEEGLPSPEGLAYNAFDARLGAMVGWTFLHGISPYALARAFGGPVFWTYQGDSVTGTDTHHYQVGAGVLARVSRQFDVFAEGVPLGELAISAGVGLTF